MDHVSRSESRLFFFLETTAVLALAFVIVRGWIVERKKDLVELPSSAGRRLGEMRKDLIQVQRDELRVRHALGGSARC
jgi:hypothetical protein